MKFIIFAGGSGKRFWPISRNKMPKQFIPLINGKSTFQLQVERIKKITSADDIFVSTNEKYVSIVKDQNPEIPTSNIIAEPARKDLLAALGYVLVYLRKAQISEPVFYMAADALIKNNKVFENAIKIADKLILENKKRFVYFGEKPLYPTNNLGWIHIGELIKKSNSIKVHKFKGWIYRPDIKLCEKMFENKQWVWNVNFEAFDVNFALSQYKKFFPESYRKLEKIEKALGTRNQSQTIKTIYPTLEEKHSDDLWNKSKESEAVVLNLNMGWSDPGTLYQLKKEFEKTKNENVTVGKVFNYKTKDCLVINRDKGKLIATMNLDGMVVVNTSDVLLIVDKNNVRFLGEMLEKFKDTDLEKYL